MTRNQGLIAGVIVALGVSLGGISTSSWDVVGSPEPRPTVSTAGGLSGLAVWDDGYSEMSYYQASDFIYGTERKYTRVQLVNRQWMSEKDGIKVEPNDPDAVPVLKFNISEEVPTENYNYRYLNTIFLKRPDLSPFKMVTSSQEWCGTTFKHLRWAADGLSVQSFSYFPGEGDEVFSPPAQSVPYEALFLIARDVVACGEARELTILPSLRSNREVTPRAVRAKLVPGERKVIKVPAGRFEAVAVALEWPGPSTSFFVEAAPPYRLLRYRAGGLHGELVLVERRPYWDRNSKSKFYKQGAAP